MQPNYISSYDQMGGLIERVKPFKLPDQAFATLDNAYVNRDKVIKRGCLEKLGRLRRVLTTVSIGNIAAGGAGVVVVNIFSAMAVAVTEPNAELVPGSASANLVIAIAAPINQTLTDSTGTGSMTVGGAGPITAATINYITGDLTLTFSGVAGASAATITGSYYPTLPAMGIRSYEQATINVETTVFFDTKYAYVYTAGNFQELATGTTWAGADWNFFWTCNYRGANANDRLFFVTNNVDSAANPMRYYNGTWNAFTPRVVSGGGTLLLTALILIPYYGRLIALNVTEGAALGGGTVYVNRCRYSQVGSPIAVSAWDTDVFGRGGFIDAPTSEAIVCASFVKNTLVVRFERSTWQLRYNGDYGLPFIWERISSDFGGESTFSDVIFDDGVLSVGNRAITIGNGTNVQRIDEAIPDKVFSISNSNNGIYRVHGIKDYQKELVYWCYPEWADTDEEGTDEPVGYFPNKVLIYNYINKTWATFRDNITCFGYFQSTANITWDSTTTSWDDYGALWDDIDTQAYFPSVVCGNQKGYIHYYNYTSIEGYSLNVKAVSGTTLTIPNHNLVVGEFINISPGLWSTTAPADAGILQITSVVDANTITVTGYSAGVGTYLGGSQVILYPRMYIETKDFNPYLPASSNLKLIYVDFLMDFAEDGEFQVEIYINSDESIKGNLVTGQQLSETNLPAGYYVPNSDIAWHRFYATCNGQFVRIIMTYDNDQMADAAIQRQIFVLNAMRFWTRPGGQTIF